MNASVSASFMTTVRPGPPPTHKTSTPVLPDAIYVPDGQI
jgi:hypothetical protein